MKEIDISIRGFREPIGGNDRERALVLIPAVKAPSMYNIGSSAGETK